MKLEVTTIATADLTETCCQSIRKAAADKGLEFRCEVAPDVPERITGDAQRIRQLLFNLLGNAVKFTSRGSVVLRAEVSADGRFLLFSVEDTGPGMAPETLGVLFKPFTQADSTLARPFEGTGLGLAISHRLAEAMGGLISVDSTVGKGSTFAFHLPLEPQSAPVRALVAEKSSGTVCLDGRPVLVVEDDPVCSQLTGRFLENLGMRVEFATDGKAAVEAFAPGKFAAILMDMQMPVMNGLDATAAIRGIEEAKGGRVRIIALTANVMPGDQERCFASGMDDFLAKPFKKDELAAMLARAAHR